MLSVFRSLNAQILKAAPSGNPESERRASSARHEIKRSKEKTQSRQPGYSACFSSSCSHCTVVDRSCLLSSPSQQLEFWRHYVMVLRCLNTWLWCTIAQNDLHHPAPSASEKKEPVPLSHSQVLPVLWLFIFFPLLFYSSVRQKPLQYQPLRCHYSSIAN